MSNVVNLNSRRTLKERFNLAVQLIDSFDFQAYINKKDPLSAESMLISLSDEMVKTIDEPDKEEIFERETIIELNELFANFLTDDIVTVSQKDIENQKKIMRQSMTNLLIHTARSEGMNLDSKKNLIVPFL